MLVNPFKTMCKKEPGKNNSIGRTTNNYKKYLQILKVLKIKTDLIKAKTNQWGSS
jgi:hypothetical protein